MAKKFYGIFLLAVMFLGLGSANAAFKDVKLDLTNGRFLTAEEKGDVNLNFGVAIADDGTATRVAADDASANIVLSGKYHSDDHGWGWFSAKVAVEGPVRVSMGSCAWGGDVTVKNEAGETVATFNTNIGACYHGDKENNIVSAIYKGEATTLTIAGGSYTPYIAVEAVDPSALVEDIDVKFSLGDVEAEGILPADFVVESGSKFTLPANHTLYVAGKTLTGWTDGSTVYAIGEEVTAPDASVTLTPVFTDNKVNLADRASAVTLLWDFQRRNGAPLIGFEDVTGVYVCQALVNGVMIDVKLDFDTTNGKINNGGWTDWAQLNPGTILTVPSCEGAVISMEAYSNITTTTIDGQTDYTQNKVIEYTIGGDAPTVDIVIGDGSYYRYVKVILPFKEQSEGGKVFADTEASAYWTLESGENLEVTTVEPADGISVAVLNTGDLTITGAAPRTADPKTDYNFVKFKPAGTTNYLEWYVEPAAGLTFTPTNFSVCIQRFGTDAENGVVITGYNADRSVSLPLGTFTAPRANQDATKDKYAGNANSMTEVSIDLTEEQMSALAGEGFYVTATIGVGSSKEGGFAHARISGKLNGRLADVNKYAVTAAASPEEAAEVSLYPKASEYKEGATVKVSAVKNFGYQFINWTDQDGNVVSEEPVFNLTVDKAYTLTANFNALNTYALNYSVDGGANLYMVQPSPAPTVVDGRNMYEEGTNVSLVASSNPLVTFTNWSDGQTSGEIALTMDRDIDIVANYSAVDYIVGWDFYLSGANGRKADFASADNDATMLVLRNADGETQGWLDKSWQAAGGYEGRPGAVNWRTTGLGDWYWQTKVNASAFTNIAIQTEMCYNYNAYTTYNVEYSLDGENWTLAGAISMGGVKNWTEGRFELPAECNNQAELLIRWIADKNSAVDGTTSANDGICLGATWITGDEALVDDGTAPVLVSTVPVEGADNASANGKVVLTFDEKVKVKEGAYATLGEQKLNPAVAGKVVTFEYRGLTYSTDYTFRLPAGSVMDLTDNAIANDITINFTTKTKPVVEKGMFDFIVPDDGDFRAAIDAANARQNKDVRFRIFIKQGDHVSPTKGERPGTGPFENKTYPDPRVDLVVDNVSIIGEGMDITSVVNVCPDAVDGTNPIEGLRNAYTLHNSGTGTYIQDLMLINGLKDNTGRGEAYEESGDKTILKNVGLWGYQDTYCSNNGRGRYYFEGGMVRGRTDYICGRDDIFFNGVEFRNVPEGGYIAVPSAPKKYGWILRDCRITADKGDNAAVDGKFTLGRPWGKGTPIALWINTICEVLPSSAGWNEMSGGYPARFAEYNTMTASGTVVDLSGRKRIFGDGFENNPILSAEEAAFYTVANVLGGDDNWDPTEMTEQASAPTSARYDVDNNRLTWDDNDYVLCWAVCVDGRVVDFTTEPSYELPAAEVSTVSQPVYSVRAANEMGGLGEAAIAAFVSADLIMGNAAEIVDTEYYNLTGARVDARYQGVVLRVDTLADGTVVTTKLVNK